VTGVTLLTRARYAWDKIMSFDVSRLGGSLTRSVAVANFPQRPNSGVLSESIPLFFISRNKLGFWIAREAQGRTGGVFLFKRSARRFADRSSAPTGCATMSLNERMELDLENQGNPLAAWLVRFASRLTALIPRYPPPIAFGRQLSRKGRWR
jgi:hypothetical protein